MDQVRQGHRQIIVRGNLQGALQITYGLVLLAGTKGSLCGHRQIGCLAGILGVCLQGLCDGRIGLALRQSQPIAAKRQIAVLRMGFGNRVKDRRRPGKIAFGNQSRAKIGLGDDKARIQRQCALKGRDGGIGLAHGHLGIADQVIGPDCIRSAKPHQPFGMGQPCDGVALHLDRGGKERVQLDQNPQRGGAEIGGLGLLAHRRHLDHQQLVAQDADA